MHSPPEPQSLSEVQGESRKHLPASMQTSPEPRCRRPQVPDSGAQTELLQEASQGLPQEPVLQAVTVVDVVVFVVVVVVVVGRVQLGPLPGTGHASQQLAQTPTLPCFAVQCAASFLILHLVPLMVVMQQVTAPAGFPQIEWDAHLFTNRVQFWFTSTVFACCSAQLT